MSSIDTQPAPRSANRRSAAARMLARLRTASARSPEVSSICGRSIRGSSTRVSICTSVLTGPRSGYVLRFSKQKRTIVRHLETRRYPMSTATTQPIATGTWAIDKVHSHVGFAVKHMVVSTFRGRFEDYDGTLTVGEDGAPRLEGSVEVDSIVVKDENLAGHLKAPDFFDSENYPQIRFA